MLDNVGIYVNLSNLPSAQKFQAARRRKYGTHWLSRFWCQKLRPHLSAVLALAFALLALWAFIILKRERRR